MASNSPHHGTHNIFGKRSANKYSENPGTSKSMRIAESDLGLDHLYVVHPGKHTYPLTENITASTLPDAIKAL